MEKVKKTIYKNFTKGLFIDLLRNGQYQACKICEILKIGTFKECQVTINNLLKNE